MEIFLPIATSYISHWSLEEGIRELIANARDKVGANREQMVFAVVEKEDETYDLTIGNLTDGEKLETRHLVLGVSEHRNSVAAIGQFGEGLKLALVTILRSNRQEELVIVNHDEVWTVSLAPNPQMGDTIMPLIRIEPCEPQNRVTFHIKDLNKYELASVMQTMWESVEKSEGIENEEVAIYRSETCRSLFVGGIAMGDLRWGFVVNTIPYGIEVNRDRKLPNSIEEVEVRLRKLICEQFEYNESGELVLLDASREKLLCDIEVQFSLFEGHEYMHNVLSDYQQSYIDDEEKERRIKAVRVARWLDRNLLMRELSEETGLSTLEEMLDSGVCIHNNWSKQAVIKKNLPHSIYSTDQALQRAQHLRTDDEALSAAMERLLNVPFSAKTPQQVYSELHSGLYAFLSDVIDPSDAAEKTNELLLDFQQNLI